jgi:ABC-type multidrug transport system ATPase subunit
MIETKNLVKRYGAFTAVDNINVSIPPGEIYGFLGPNGAGKTSTIMMLLGITRPTSGEITLFGERYQPGRLDLRRRIGVVPENHPKGVWAWMTAFEYLKMFADLFRLKDSLPRIDHLLKQVGLAEVRNKKISEFSRGMLQKLSITRALLSDPDILFLDEPISGLDPIGIKQVRDLILAENREGRTIFISSHLLSEMEKICHRVAIIFRGRLMAEDRMELLLGKLAQDREIQVDLEDLPPDLPDQITSLPFVLGSVRKENTLVVKVPKEGDFRKEISEFMIKLNLVPLRIQESSLSLEEAFVTITNKNIEMFANLGGQNE